MLEGRVIPHERNARMTLASAHPHYLDKMVDELAKGDALGKVLRTA